jgi:predicted nucleic acid-binding protein
MKYVLDSNVALKWVLPESDSAKAIQIRDGYLNGVHELLAPDIFVAEIGHSLTRLERRGLISSIDGAQKFSDVLAALPQIDASLAVSTRAYEISSQARHGLYECVYVSLAEREGCELLTADTRLITKLQGLFPFIRSLMSLP